MPSCPSTPFVVAAVSRNTGAFGHRGVIIIAHDGEAWELCITDQFAPKKGDRVCYARNGCRLIHSDGRSATVECPRKLNNAPPLVVAQVWEK